MFFHWDSEARGSELLFLLLVKLSWQRIFKNWLVVVLQLDHSLRLHVHVHYLFFALILSERLLWIFRS